jgi:hypothetical protein
MRVTPCPVCNLPVVECDNNVRLDYPATVYDDTKAPWTIMHLGPMNLASVGNPSIGGTGHALHEHQPEESVMA